MDDVSLKVFVGSIDFNATEKDVEEAFKPYGEIVHVILLRDKDTQKSRGFGFVTFKERHSVEAAIKGMHKQPILGRPCVVNYAEKKSNSNAGGGANANTFNQQGPGFGGDSQQPNPYYQGFPAQQQYGGWNDPNFNYQQYWQQQYGAWGHWWAQQMQQQQQQAGAQPGANYSATQNFNGNTNFNGNYPSNPSGGGGNSGSY